MKIAIIGYGKMGKAIEEIALRREHAIELKISSANTIELTADNLHKCDVAVDFSGPEYAFENIVTCLTAGIPVVSGSTGWLDKLNEIHRLCLDIKGTFLYASNFSVGVNLFFNLNKKLAELMVVHPDYIISIEEVHHTQKKDAPSGTALTLSNQIREIRLKEGNVQGSEEDITITSKRIDPTPGTHAVKYHSAVDDIEIRHTAHNRKGFALGAVLATEYIFKKKGVFTMQDVLGIA
jgi:4-hydroxy-tetrahydrodipicolinate reductase